MKPAALSLPNFCFGGGEAVRLLRRTSRFQNPPSDIKLVGRFFPLRNLPQVKTESLRLEPTFRVHLLLRHRLLAL